MKSGLLNKIGAFIMVGFLIFLIIKRYIIDENKLTSNYKLTEAIIYKISYPVDGGPDADFQYIVNKKLYKGYKPFDPTTQKITVGNKFVLKYYPPNPKIAKILLDKPLP
jgi:hypothetical protein